MLHDDSSGDGGQKDVIYSDFEKAFDKVPHKKRLISKLHTHSIDESKWVSGFLCVVRVKFCFLLYASIFW